MAKLRNSESEPDGTDTKALKSSFGEPASMSKEMRDVLQRGPKILQRK
jgi:hypothetical protein